MGKNKSGMWKTYKSCHCDSPGIWEVIHVDWTTHPFPGECADITSVTLRCKSCGWVTCLVVPGKMDDKSMVKLRQNGGE